MNLIRLTLRQVRRHRYLKVLAPHLIDQLEDYIPTDLTRSNPIKLLISLETETLLEILGNIDDYVLAHGDLNERHVFLKETNGQMTLSGMIDFDSGGVTSFKQN